MLTTTTIQISREDEFCPVCNSGESCRDHTQGLMAMDVVIEADVADDGNEYGITGQRVVSSECGLVEKWADLTKDERTATADAALIEEFKAEKRTEQAKSDALDSLPALKFAVANAAVAYLLVVGERFTDDDMFEALGKAREELLVAMRTCGVAS